MQPIFVDESGDLGFGCGTKYFVLAFIAPDQGRLLNKLMKNFNAHLIRSGWNQNIEIKATNVWHSSKNADISSSYMYKSTPEVPMQNILNSLSTLGCPIEFTVIKLDTVKPGLQTAPCAILYNYFSWMLLRRPLGYHPDIELFVDRRNKETHNNLKFDGYIESKAGIQRAEDGKPPLNLLIHHYHYGSPNEFTGPQRANVEYGVRGLEAADFICWAIKRKYENGEDQWYKLIEKCIKYKQTLYF